jgi:hypothetical protein
MSAREVIARAACKRHWGNDRHCCGGAREDCTWLTQWSPAILAALDAAGKVVVDRKTLIEARDEITAYVKREYAGCEGYPSMERRMERDLELARELGRLAAAKEGER